MIDLDILGLYYLAEVAAGFAINAIALKTHQFLTADYRRSRLAQMDISIFTPRKNNLLVSLPKLNIKLIKYNFSP
jgi:hypothetical protein